MPGNCATWDGGSTFAENMTESSRHLTRATPVSLRILATFRLRADEGRIAIRQALIKHLIPQWNRDPLRLPLLFRAPLTILVEVAAVFTGFISARHHPPVLWRTCLAVLSILGDLLSTQLSSNRISLMIISSRSCVFL